jgi:hypothetical protein
MATASTRTESLSRRNANDWRNNREELINSAVGRVHDADVFPDSLPWLFVRGSAGVAMGGGI